MALLTDAIDIHTLAKQMGKSVAMIERHYSKLTATMAASILATEYQTKDRLRLGEKMKRFLMSIALCTVIVPHISYAQSMPIRPAECYGYMSALFKQYVPNESAPLASMKRRFISESKRVNPQIDFDSGAFMGEMEFKKLDMTQQAEASKRILKSCLDLRNRIAQ